MFKEKPLIYIKINEHNKKFNPNKLFLSKKLRKHDNWFMKKIFASLTLISIIIILSSIFFLKAKDFKIIGISISLMMIFLIFLYQYFYFNRKAKKEIQHKKNVNAFSDFFKSWFSKKLKKEQLIIIKKYYSNEKINSLIEVAKLEYNFQKNKTRVIYFETMFISFLAIILTFVIELDIINGELKKINNGKDLIFEENLYVFKIVIGFVFIVLTFYIYLKWIFNQGYRDKKRKLLQFIQTMILSQGEKI